MTEAAVSAAFPAVIRARLGSQNSPVHNQYRSLIADSYHALIRKAAIRRILHDVAVYISV
jgi:hypothetical protein